MELKRESITLSSLVRRALNPTCSILICFFPRRWRRPRSRLSLFSLPPRPGYLKVPTIEIAAGERQARCFLATHKLHQLRTIFRPVKTPGLNSREGLTYTSHSKSSCTSEKSDKEVALSLEELQPYSRSFVVPHL